MHFFLALGILVLASSAYLVHQFWSRTLSSGDALQLDEAAGPAADDAQPSHLKAA